MSPHNHDHDTLAGVIGDTALHALEVVLIVFTMMVLVELLNVWTRGKVQYILRGGTWRQYVVSSFLGATPGCAGAFMNVSLYTHGLITFGALAGGFIATSGDEAFIMLALFPRDAMLLFGLLFVAGILCAYVTDRFVAYFKIKTYGDCAMQLHHPGHESVRHFIVDHVWKHIIRRHLWKIFIWIFGAMFLIDISLHVWDINLLTNGHTLYLIAAAALIGLIPQSGPHIIFITLYAGGIIPFSVLFTSAFIQDGHGLLPMLSVSVHDSIVLKAFNFGFGIIFGVTLYLFGW
jgi:hypothetical protein